MPAVSAGRIVRSMPTRIRRLAGNLPVRGSAIAVAGLAERAARRRTYLLPILTYHRVVPAEDIAAACPATVSATTAQFASQMRWIAGARRAVGIEDLLRARRGEQQIAAGSILITFDDGYADFAAHAWPILRELALPAVLFVPTASAAGRAEPFWWDRLWAALLQTDRPATPTEPVGALPVGTPALASVAHRSLRRYLKSLPHDDLLAEVDRLVGALGEPSDLPGVLDWDALRALQGEGLSVASHTVSHPLLTRVSRRRRAAELRGALDDLHRELGSVAPVLAYPGGDCDEEVARDTAAAGYEAAVTTHRGVNDLRRPDWLRLDRINVGARSADGSLRAQLSPPVAALARAFA
jgi:peptidoglycan/xylan/chitin deacetylase (PgdA/CDA1 family)